MLIQHILVTDLIESNAKALEFVLDEPLVPEWFENIEDNEDEGARPCHCDDLLASSFAVLGTLDDPWQIQQLSKHSLLTPEPTGAIKCARKVAHYWPKSSL